MKKRVLHVLSSLNIGGTELQILGIYKSLLEHNYNVEVDIFTTKKGKSQYDDELTKLGGRIFKTDLHSNPIKSLLTFRSVLKTNNYDFVHSHLYLFSGVFLCAGFFI